MNRNIVAAVLILAALSFSAAPAAKGPQARLDAYFQADFTDVSYQQAALQKVLKAWAAPRPLPAAGKKAVVVSTLQRDGTITGTYLNMQSGNEAFDRAASEAVTKASPLAPLPKSYPQPSTEIHWHFSVK